MVLGSPLPVRRDLTRIVICVGVQYNAVILNAVASALASACAWLCDGRKRIDNIDHVWHAACQTRGLTHVVQVPCRREATLVVAVAIGRVVLLVETQVKWTLVDAASVGRGENGSTASLDWLFNASREVGVANLIFVFQVLNDVRRLLEVVFGLADDRAGFISILQWLGLSHQVLMDLLEV